MECSPPAKVATYDHFQHHWIIPMITEVLVGLHRYQAKQERIEAASNLDSTDRICCQWGHLKADISRLVFFHSLNLR